MPHRNQEPLDTPVAFIIFNRPEKTLQVFAEIAKAKPRQLFVVADGPRPDHPTDEVNCAATRAVVEQIDWECTVHRNYSEQNLGCKRRISSGIDWVFDQVEEAIIVEDDIVVDPSFFRFAQEMLVYYRYDTRVMQIAGFNPIAPLNDYPYSYFFSFWPLIWGWATWRRAWQTYDVQMSLWSSDLRSQLQENPLLDPKFLNILDQTHRGEIDTWDYQWLFANLMQSGLTVVPCQNLIRNIGFGADATHTRGQTPAYLNAAPATIEFPLSHPPYVMVNPIYQKQVIDVIHATPSLPQRVVRRLRSLLTRFVLGSNGA
jgi:hypothetical protein